MSNYTSELVIKKSKSNKRFLAPIAGAVALVATASANAALDLAKLNETLTGVETAVAGAIAVAITIGVTIVGWRWVKKGLFSV